MTSSFSYDSSWTIIISFSDISFWKNIRHTISAISFQRGHPSFSPDYQPFCAEAKVGRPQVLECCDAYSAVFIIPQIPTTSQPASRAHTFILVNLRRQWWDACSFKKNDFPTFIQGPLCLTHYEILQCAHASSRSQELSNRTFYCKGQHMCEVWLN